jgi:hypothetical protein
MNMVLVVKASGYQPLQLVKGRPDIWETCAHT